MTQPMRAKGMGLHILVANCAGYVFIFNAKWIGTLIAERYCYRFINTFGNSVGLGVLKWKYYFVFIAWNLCASVLWYLFCVETVSPIFRRVLKR